MMASASAESVRAREEKDEAENVETANPEEHVAFLAKWGEGKTRATAHICNHICLSSSANISRALVSATAKAAVYSSAGKIFGDAKTSVPPRSSWVTWWGTKVGEFSAICRKTSLRGAKPKKH